MYILRNENNEIIAWSTSQINDTYVWTDEEIIEVGGHMFLASQIEEIEKETLIYAKSLKISELKSIRDNKEVEPIQTDKGLFDYDDKARERINAAIIALDVSGGTITWTLSDNTDTEVSANDLRYVIAMVAQRSNTLHSKYRTLKDPLKHHSVFSCFYTRNRYPTPHSVSIN